MRVWGVIALIACAVAATARVAGTARARSRQTSLQPAAGANASASAANTQAAATNHTSSVPSWLRKDPNATAEANERRARNVARLSHAVSECVMKYVTENATTAEANATRANCTRAVAQAIVYGSCAAFSSQESLYGKNASNRVCVKGILNTSQSVRQACQGKRFSDTALSACVVASYGQSVLVGIGGAAKAGITGAAGAVVNGSRAAATAAVRGAANLLGGGGSGASGGGEAGSEQEQEGDVVLDFPRALEAGGEGDALGAAAAASAAAGRVERSVDRLAGRLLQRLEPAADEEAVSTASGVSIGELPSSQGSDALLGSGDNEGGASHILGLGKAVARRVSDAAAVIEGWAGSLGSSFSAWFGGGDE